MAHIQKDIQTKRGLTYHYLFVPSQAGKPTLVLLHGFPSTIRDWRFQIEHFSSKGYGLVVPDMLGYGGTDKPLDVKYYSWQDMSSDILDILDAEALDKVIVVGHDWSVPPPADRTDLASSIQIQGLCRRVPFGPPPIRSLHWIRVS